MQKTTITFCAFLFLVSCANKKTITAQFHHPVFIAHASGGINGLTYLNSLEALNHNYALGHRYFEVDFNWTADNKLVLIHDWKITYKRLFGIDTQKAPTKKEFLKLKMNFIKSHPLYAVTIQLQKSYFDKVLKELGGFETPLYILSSNSLKKNHAWQKQGVDGMVTDFLYHKENKILIQ